MSYVRRYEPATTQHDCEPPMREATYHFHAGMFSDKTVEDKEMMVDGAIGDLWRCDDCGNLWRITQDDQVHRHGGYTPTEPEWRPATLWQRLRHWKEGREAWRP